MEEAKYHFTHLEKKTFNILSDKTAKDYFVKWSLKGQLKLITFSFNKSFQSHQKRDLVEKFFKDCGVSTVLNRILPNWAYNIEEVEKIEIEDIPCTISSLTFFDRLLDESNEIVRKGGQIRHCLDDFIDGFTVADELRRMLIDEESDNYGLFNEKDRQELIFKVFQFLVLGGIWCQYEDKINPYLELTKMLYKDLVSVQKNPETNKIEIRCCCLKLKLIGKDKTPLFPLAADHIQNFVYLIIDPGLRQITLFAHEYGGQF